MTGNLAAWRTRARSDAWNHRHRDEGPLHRADRNFAELLQELRVLLTAVQILLGFLLTLAFNTGFHQLDSWQHVIYVVTLLSAALSSALLVSPVAAHRVLFQCGRKPALVRWSQRASLTALAGLAVTLAAGLLLVLDIAVGRVFAVVTAIALLGVFGALWLAVPLALRNHDDGDRAGQDG